MEENTGCEKSSNGTMDEHIKAVKMCRVEMDRVIQMMRTLPAGSSREVTLAITNAQQSQMWCGMELKRCKDMGYGGENPYPNSKDPSNTIIEPVADGLKM